MTQFQAISPIRTVLCLASAAFLYAAGRYSKVENIGKATLPVALSAIAQGMQPKARTMAGENTRANTLLNLFSFGLITYGMRQALLTTRTKVLAGVALFGSQIFISLYKVQTLHDKLKNEYPLNIPAAINDHYKIENPSSISVKEKTRILEEKIKFIESYVMKCRAKLLPYDDYANCLSLMTASINEMEDANKAYAIMGNIKFFQKVGVRNSQLFTDLTLLLPLASPSDQVTINRWLKDKGDQIRNDWIQDDQQKVKLDDLKNPANIQELMESLKNPSIARHQIENYFRPNFIEANEEDKTCIIEEKIEFVKNYVIKCKNENVPFASYVGCLTLITHTDVGLKAIKADKKAIAYMDFIDFFSEIHAVNPGLFIGLNVAMNDANTTDKATVNKWLNDKGNAIKTAWEQQTQNKQ